ncbi:MAG: hypothetical protein K6C34_01015 [Alphaproteobacteria bacterium]|nr:hypothetical protein [Alphaproteobacteria bacterium]
MKKINFGQVATVFKTIGKYYSDHKRTIKRIVKYTTGTGAVVYAVSKAPKTFHDIEEAGIKKGEKLTVGEKAKIVLKNEYPAMILGTVAVGTDISLDLDAGKEIKAVTEENTSLLGQIAEIGNAYNTVNVVKEAMTKKVVETQGEEVAQQVRVEATEPIIKKGYNRISAESAYIEDADKVEEWNEIYLRTGNNDYKPQEYYISKVGQKVVLCNYAVRAADSYLNALMHPETGKGFVNLNEVLSELKARQVDGVIGDNFVWRWSYENFHLMTREICIDGVAMMSIEFISEPYFDKECEYYD